MTSRHSSLFQPHPFAKSTNPLVPNACVKCGRVPEHPIHTVEKPELPEAA